VNLSDRHARKWALPFASAYLFFLVFSVTDELNGHHPGLEVVATLSAVAIFVAIYLAFWGRVYMAARPRLAIAILVGLCVIAAGLSFVNFNNFGGLFIYCATVAGSSLQWRRSWMLVLAVSLLTLLFALIRPGDPIGRAAVTGIVLLAGMGMVGFNRLNVLVRELHQARDELARLAVAEERLRFARDLHDLLGHSLSVIVLKSELAGKLAGPAPERATREVQDIERVAREALREVRDAVSGYRQPRLEEEIEGARQALKAAGMSVKIERTGGHGPAPVEGVLAWAVREGSTNVLRHSRAHRVSILLARDHEVARLEILDDGLGVVPGAAVAAGSGLRGLSERVEARQGSVEFGPRAEGGFRLAVGLPLTPVLEAAAAE
jgi:two-component system, NarL family, sensor histidine kinase DesK